MQTGFIERRASPRTAPAFEFTERDFRQVVALIYDRAGIKLADGKRDMVYSRLGRRLRQLGMASFADYLRTLDSPQSDEWEHFTNALTTNLTSFFREPHHFEAMRDFLLAHRGQPSFKIWSCASSTGEEPYSIAMTAVQTLRSPAPPLRILATDLDTRVLDFARRGIYAQERVKNLSKEQLQRHFLKGAGPNEGMVRVKSALQALVEFRQLNLLHEHWGVDQSYDIVFCRNVMIYFDKPTQREILIKLRQHLKPDGLLFAGHSESFLHSADLFKNMGRTIYRPLAVT